jgi:hypothetical protein
MSKSVTEIKRPLNLFCGVGPRELLTFQSALVTYSPDNRFIPAGDHQATGKQMGL